jgi:hypothetical protein
MKYSQENYQLLKNVLIACKKHLKDHPEVADKGTCKFDTNTIDLTGWRQTVIDILAKETGIKIGNKLSSRFWTGNCFIYFDVPGQAGARTYFVTEANKFLKENKIDCSIYYGLD